MRRERTDEMRDERDRRSIFIGGLSYVSSGDWEAKKRMTEAIKNELEVASGTRVRKVTIFFEKRTGLVEFEGRQQALLEETVEQLVRKQPVVRDHLGVSINIQKIRPFIKGKGKRKRSEERPRFESGKGSDDRGRPESRREESRESRREEGRGSHREGRKQRKSSRKRQKGQSRRKKRRQTRR